MDTTSGTVTVWQSGRLAPRATARRFGFSREQWLATAMLVLSALVLTAFVAVLQKDVDSGAMQHQAQRSRAAALETPATVPSAADDTADAAAYERENVARATTLSLIAAR